MSTSSDLNKWKGFQSRKCNVICWVLYNKVSPRDYPVSCGVLVVFMGSVRTEQQPCVWAGWWHKSDFSHTTGISTVCCLLILLHLSTPDNSLIRCGKVSQNGEKSILSSFTWAEPVSLNVVIVAAMSGGKSMIPVLELEHNFIRHNNGVWMTLLITFHPAPSLPPFAAPFYMAGVRMGLSWRIEQ